MALWEICLPVGGEILIDLGITSTSESFQQRSRAHPVLAGIGVLLLGGISGAMTRLVLPAPIFPPGPVRGLSLLLSPLVTGVVMDRYGAWRDGRGAPRSFVATFWGGALFGFGMALVRFVWVER